MPFILIESPMFWGTAENTGSDSRERNNAGQLCAQRQPVWTWLPASLLSEPFLTFTGNWEFKGEVRGELFPVPPPVVLPFHLVKKVGGMADVFHFVLYQVICWDKLLGFQPHWQNSFLPLSFFIWLVFKRMVMEGHSTLFVCLLKQHPRARAFYLLLQTNILHVWKSHYRNKWEERTPCRGIVTHVMLRKACPWWVFTNWTFPSKPYTGKDVEYGKNLR